MLEVVPRFTICGNACHAGGSWQAGCGRLGNGQGTLHGCLCTASRSVLIAPAHLSKLCTPAQLTRVVGDAADKQEGRDAAQLADTLPVAGDAPELQVTICSLYCVSYRKLFVLWCTAATEDKFMANGLLAVPFDVAIIALTSCVLLVRVQLWWGSKERTPQNWLILLQSRRWCRMCWTPCCNMRSALSHRSVINRRPCKVIHHPSLLCPQSIMQLHSSWHTPADIITRFFNTVPLKPKLSWKHLLPS